MLVEFSNVAIRHGFLFDRKFFITESISLFITGIFGFSYFSQFSLGGPMAKNLSFSSKLFYLLVYDCLQ